MSSSPSRSTTHHLLPNQGSPPLTGIPETRLSFQSELFLQAVASTCIAFLFSRLTEMKFFKAKIKHFISNGYPRLIVWWAHLQCLRVGEVYGPPFPWLAEPQPVGQNSKRGFLPTSDQGTEHIPAQRF